MANNYEIALNGNKYDVTTINRTTRNEIIATLSEPLQNKASDLMAIAENAINTTKSMAVVLADTRKMYDSDGFNAPMTIENFVTLATGSKFSKATISGYVSAVNKFKDSAVWNVLNLAQMVKLAPKSFELEKIVSILDSLEFVPASKIQQVYFDNFDVATVENTDGENTDGENTDGENTDEKPTDAKWIKWLNENLTYITDVQLQKKIKNAVNLVLS